MSTNSVEAKKQWPEISGEQAFHEVPILLIDDDQDFADLLSEELSQIPGAKVVVAHNANQAVSQLATNRFVLIVSDWALDRDTGFDVLNAADPLVEAGYWSKTPVLFMSGSDKVSAAQNLRGLNHFEPVSFILKRFGAALISLLAENIVERFFASEARGASGYLS